MTECRKRISAFFEIKIAVCVIFDLIVIVVWLLDFEDQLPVDNRDHNMLVFMEEDPGKSVLTRERLAVIVNRCFYSRCVLQYDLSLVVKRDTEVSTDEFYTSAAQQNIIFI